MKQGDVYWYTFHAPNKRRPVLILTRNSAIPYLSSDLGTNWKPVCFGEWYKAKIEKLLDKER